jgi:hypothetical protein
MQLVITSIDFTKKITVTNALSFVFFERVIVVSIIDLSTIFIAALSLPPILKSSLLLSPKKQQQGQEVTMHE